LNLYFKELKDEDYFELFQTYEFLEFFDFVANSRIFKCNSIHLVDELKSPAINLGAVCLEKQNEGCEWFWGIIKSTKNAPHNP